MNNNNSTTIDSRTSVEVIPILTPENYKDVVAHFRERPTLEQFRNPDKLSSDGLGRFVLDTVTTIDGNPTEWLVALNDDTMFMTSLLPCSVPNCTGHGSIGLEDTWTELSHEVAQLDLKPSADLEHLYRSAATAELYLRAGGDAVGFCLEIEGELPPADLGKLADYFEQTSERLRTFIDTFLVKVAGEAD